jgi:hypothetical protein
MAASSSGSGRRASNAHTTANAITRLTIALTSTKKANWPRFMSQSTSVVYSFRVQALAAGWPTEWMNIGALYHKRRRDVIRSLPRNNRHLLNACHAYKVSRNEWQEHRQPSVIPPSGRNDRLQPVFERLSASKATFPLACLDVQSYYYRDTVLLMTPLIDDACALYLDIH